MNSFQRKIVALSAVAFSSLGVNAAYVSEIGVECREEAPEICVGRRYYYTPSPVSICPEEPPYWPCNTTYSGGWGWGQTFVEGLEEGIDDYLAIEEAKTGLEIEVRIEDDRSTCKVMVTKGSEYRGCKSCDAGDCGYLTIKYDCTNLEKGLSSLDECVDPSSIYPFEIKPIKEEKKMKKKKKKEKKKKKKKMMKKKRKEKDSIVPEPDSVP